MDKTEFSMFVAIRAIGGTIVATQPLNLFPYQSLAASCVGIAGLLWMFYLIGLWMGNRSTRRESNRSNRNRSTRTRNRKA